MSNRAVAAQFGVSYQTADRLLGELCAAGLLVRRAGAGTFLPGDPDVPARALLVFHRRARRRDSFGARLLAELAARLEREGTRFDVRFVGDEAASAPAPIRGDVLPVLWEAPAVLAALAAEQRRGVLLNDRPPPGLASLVIDSVSVDNHTGGACAAQLLARDGGRRYAVLAGPEHDGRSDARVKGFRSLLPRAQVVHCPTWFRTDARPLVRRVVRAGADGVFCCNDRLAEAVLGWCAKQRDDPPRLVGFDDAPIAERLDLATICIPWADLAQVTAGVIRRRLQGDRAPASRQIIAPGIAFRASLRRR